MAIIRAIVAGEREALVLAQLRNAACRSPDEQFVKALQGSWWEEYRFIIGPALAIYDFYTQQIAACDAQIERFYTTLQPRHVPEAESSSTTMSKFPSAKAFGSWLGLAPHNDISGGRVLRSGMRKVVNRAAQAFRLAAQSVARTDSAFGAYFRRMQAKLGPQQAIVATAYKIGRRE